MWLLITLAAITVFWALNIYFRDDGTKLKHSPVIEGPLEPKKTEAYSNKSIFFVGIGLFGLLVFVFFAAS